MDDRGYKASKAWENYIPLTAGVYSSSISLMESIVEKIKNFRQKIKGQFGKS